MATNDKDTIYIDIDDEITTIIEKVRAADSKIVALVLPKRATVLQSIVNMKLLKRSAENEKKSLVLITSEAGLMPLAGTVGLYVAKTLQTKPEVPVVASVDEADELADEASLDDDEPEEVTADTAGNRPVGELAGASAVAAPAASDAIETLQLDDEPVADEKPSKKSKEPKKKKDKKLAVPNFEKFRMLLIVGGLVIVLLIVGVIVAAKVLPKASIVVTTDTSDVESSLTFTADTTAKQLDTSDPSKVVLPAISQQTQKTQNQQVPTTGQQNNGTVATGTVTMSASACAPNLGQPNSVPSGTPVTSGGLVFVTQETTKFSALGSGSGSCQTYQALNPTDVTAQAGGTKYNLSNASFTVYARSDLSANGSATGGTDDIIQTVAQADITSATQKIAALDTTALKQQLENQLKQAGLFPLEATFVAGTPTTTSSSNVGDQATTVTVTQAITYTMFGVQESDLKTLVDNDIKGKIDPSKQSILTEGLDKASFHVNTSSTTSAVIAMSTTATAGPDLNADTLKKQLAGQKAGEVSDTLKADPGVTDVKVNLSPFWVTSVPSKASKVTITFQKAQ